MLSTDDEVPMRRSAVEGEHRRDRGEMLHDHLGIEPHAIALDPRPNGGETRPCIGVKEVDPRPVQHLERGEMDGLDLVVGDHPGWGLGVPRLLGRRLIADHGTRASLPSLARPNLGHRDKVAPDQGR